MEQNQTTNAPANQQEPSQFPVISKAAREVTSYMNAMIKGGLVMPEGYTILNAVTSATLKLQEIKDKNFKTLEDGICTPVSIATALKSMLTKGEDIAQGHGYFIIRGNQLCYDESYLGCLHRIYRDTNVTRVNAQVVYEGDDFQFTSDKGEYRILKHDSSLANINLTKIVGAYAIVFVGDKVKHVEIMNMDMIRKAWAMSKNPNGKIFTDYPDQMAKRTVIKRACKVILAAEVCVNKAFDEFDDYEDVTDFELQQRNDAQEEKHDVMVEDVQVVEETGEIVNVAAASPSPAQPSTSARRERKNLLV